MTQQELYDGFMALVNNGDEAGARAFILDHLNEFPEEIKNQLAFEFFVEAVQKDAAIEIIKEKAMEVLKEGEGEQEA